MRRGTLRDATETACAAGRVGNPPDLAPVIGAFAGAQAGRGQPARRRVTGAADGG